MRGILFVGKCLMVYILLPVFTYRFSMTVKNILLIPIEYLYFSASVPVSCCYGGDVWNWKEALAKAKAMLVVCAVAPYC